MPSNTRFRRLTDLFVQGKAVPMPDGSHLWVQVINAFERDEALSDAQVARARIILGLRQNGSERLKVQARLIERGREVMAEDLASAKVEAKGPDFVDDMRSDPEWKERMDIYLRTDTSEGAKPLTEDEQQLIVKLNAEILEELAHRESEEKDFLLRSYHRMNDEEFIDVWVEEWLERRGSDLAAAEFRLTEIWYASRYCDASLLSDGVLDHTACDGHRTRVFETKQEARSAPTALQELLRAALDELNVAGRDPKDSDSATSSSDSLPAPSAEEGSTPSTSDATPSSPPGT